MKPSNPEQKLIPNNFSLILFITYFFMAFKKNRQNAEKYSRVKFFVTLIKGLKRNNVKNTCKLNRLWYTGATLKGRSVLFMSANRKFY